MQAICGSLQEPVSDASKLEQNNPDVSVESEVPIDVEAVKVNIDSDTSADVKDKAVDETPVEGLDGSASAEPESDAASLKRFLSQSGILEHWSTFQADVLPAYLSKYMSEFGGVEELRNVLLQATQPDRFPYGAEDFPSGGNTVEEDFEFEEFDNSEFKWDAFAVGVRPIDIACPCDVLLCRMATMDRMQLRSSVRQQILPTLEMRTPLQVSTASRLVNLRSKILLAIQHRLMTPLLPQVTLIHLV